MSDPEPILRIWECLDRSRRLEMLMFGPPRDRNKAAAEALADLAAAPDIFRRFVDSCAKIKAAERSSNGTKSSAEKAHIACEWMSPIFDQACSEFEAQHGKLPGWQRLQKAAWSIAGRDHPRRDELSEHHARTYITNLKAARALSRKK